MVTGTKRKFVSIEEAKQIYRRSRSIKEAEAMLSKLPKRQPCPPPPEGGISQSAGARKYNILQPTISRWVQKGYLPLIAATSKEKYVDEKRLAELARIYHASSGQGKGTLKKFLSISQGALA
jgi:hypothetical protein